MYFGESEKCTLSSTLLHWAMFFLDIHAQFVHHLIIDELSPEVTTTHRGNPSADDHVDMTTCGSYNHQMMMTNYFPT